MMLTPARARKEAEALRITAGAMADAKKLLTTSNAEIQGQLTVGEMVELRVQFQEAKRQANILGVYNKAVEELQGAEVVEHEPDQDWTARFFNYIQDVSSEDMQLLWAKVLAGEVERPGGTSIRTLNILRNLDMETAGLFGKLCSICLEFYSAEDIVALDLHIISPPHMSGFGHWGLGIRVLDALNEHGLIVPNYQSELNFRLGKGPWAESQTAGTRITFQSRTWMLEAREDPDDIYTFGSNWQIEHPKEEGGDYRLVGQRGVVLTKAGRELARFVEPEPANEYASKLRSFLQLLGLRMIAVKD